MRPLLLHLRVAACLALLCAGGAAVGCKWAPRVGITQADSSPRYDRASVVYELNGAQRPLPLKVNQVSPASFDLVERLREPDPAGLWARATLSIQYPHPDGSTEMARATLRLSSLDLSGQLSAPDDGEHRRYRFQVLNPTAENALPESQFPAFAQRDDEIWVLDFPKEQLDLLLADLATSGFFESQLRSSTGAHLDVQIDRGRTQKSWTPEPRLDHFVARVYREGRLAGFVTCAAESPGVRG